MRVLYFAWLQSKIQKDEEEVTPPAAVKSVGQLADWLQTLSPGHAAVFSERARLRAAVNQTFASWETPLSPTDEVAFFPPVTGG
ncbi:MAG TPA: molybdopterin converting factor subunit 1 [Rhodospirillaceae bacterium]|nr:molybdopterin converting factor subunit 1 [Rhodospirillaceae bacterium]